MHTTHWGLEKAPFPTGTAEPVFYLGIPQREALARMRFLVHNQRRLGLLVGAAGSGKSLTLDCFSEEFAKHFWHGKRLCLVNLNVREFYWQLALALRAAPRLADDMPRLLRRWEDRLRGNQLQEETTVLLLDDADQAGADLLPVILRLVQLPAARVGDLTIILTAQEGQESRLGKQLLEYVDLRIELDAWDADDTSGYLQTALEEAGAVRPLFDDQALEEIRRLTGGLPRQLNRLADHALLVGSSLGLDCVDASTVAEAHTSLEPTGTPAVSC